MKVMSVTELRVVTIQVNGKSWSGIRWQAVVNSLCLVKSPSMTIDLNFVTVADVKTVCRNRKN